MALDLKEFLKTHRTLLKEEERRLDLFAFKLEKDDDVEKGTPETDDLEEKENKPVPNSIITGSQPQRAESKQDERDRRQPMLRYGEFSPNNPQLRVNAAPYLGLGEYEQRKEILLQQRHRDYKQNINSRNERIKSTALKLVKSPSSNKSVQTDLQNINNKLIQYTPPSAKQKPETAVRSGDLSLPLGPPTIETTRNIVMHNNRSPVLHRLDQRIAAAAAHNSSTHHKPEMDKQPPRGILTNRRTESPRERLLSDLKHSYVPNSLMDGFSYSDRSEDIERERIKREIYQNELRLQIEEKRRIVAMREEQERREQELENRRLEQQLLRMQEEQLRDEQRRNRREQMRRNSDDFATRKQEMQSSRQYRKHTDSESSVSNIRGTPKLSSHYSPPVARRNPYSYNIPSTSVFAEPSTRYNPSRYDSFLRNRMDSLNVPSVQQQDTTNYYSSGRSQFGRYDSLSRIDSLKHQDALSSRLEMLNISDSLSRVQRRHSATQQDLSMIRRSPKLQRRSSSSRFEDSLPIPVLKAHSPVARELKNSIAVNSTRSDAVRRLEDKWQIPAVQKNIVNQGDGQSRSILTQLGSIRMQLQQEQLRMDETLRKRGNTQSKAVELKK
ncbi:PREDICTED: trichohyalin isoform X2 [Nicrophorus vespilloides]|uniref:Trichohyalin isoform X2 n=1 Tax=Nicrophorus vespilloides TaxID=110193 RepID=A0ABM1N4Z5_NICVS|nr:PREDICTED: trichohyalin isoform X2 [Nicrophorus vespilloides]